MSLFFALAAMGAPYRYKLTDLTELRVEATGNVITGFRLTNSGVAQSGDGNPSIAWNNSPADEWQFPTNTIQAALFEVEAVESSRSDPGANATFTGTVGSSTWQALSSTIAWTLLQPEDLNINAEWVIDMTIRSVADQLTVATNRVTLQSRVV